MKYVILVISACLLVACGSSAPQSKPAAPDKSATPAAAATAKPAAAPKELLNIPDGSGTKSTQKFTTGGDYDLAWTATDTAGYSCNFIVQVQGGTSFTESPIAVNAIVKGETKQDVTHRHSGGTYWLDVNSTCGKWTIKVTG